MEQTQNPHLNHLLDALLKADYDRQYPNLELIGKMAKYSQP